MKTQFFIKIYSSVVDLPENWNDFSVHTIFLKRDYLSVLEKSAPENMTCHFIGFFLDNELVGIAISQFLDLNKLASFGERDRCVQQLARNFILKKVSSHILIIGNNMVTGENAFSFSEKINNIQISQALVSASKLLKSNFKKKGLKVHITSYKDFTTETSKTFDLASFKNHFEFSAQPNMILEIPNNWQAEQDYVNALSKKYRDQFKRARKKAEGIVKRKMSLEDIQLNEKSIYELYFHVAKNAPFNTFFLAKNHFSIFKEILKDDFLLYGYFLNDTLIGFNTLIKNGNRMDTYFLGYDDTMQREKMLYLNMLYDMLVYSIKKGFREIVFARTALEIKSSIGAKPVEMYVLAKYSNLVINRGFEKIYNYLEPKANWKQRHPFKE